MGDPLPPPSRGLWGMNPSIFPGAGLRLFIEYGENHLEVQKYDLFEGFFKNFRAIF